MTNPLYMVPPQAVTSAMLTATDVPEADYPLWSSSTTYALGDRVIRTSTHKVYQSAQASNTNHEPQSSPEWWTEVGPTNRWALFDLEHATQTAQSTSMSYTLQLSAGINALALLNLTGANSVRVRLTHPDYGTIYDTTTNVASLPEESGWWPWFFGARSAPATAVWTDLPGILGCTLIVDFTGTTDLACGVMLFGQRRSIGLGVTSGARVGIKDYSRQETNDFGDLVLVRRKSAKRATFEVPVRTSDVDTVVELLNAYRSTPCLWIGTSRYGSTVVYGIYQNFDIVFAYDAIAECSLELLGLT